MSIPEIIGFIVSFGFLLFLILRNIWEANYRRKHPEEYARKQKEKERQVRELMRSIDMDVEEDVELRRPQKPVRAKPQPKPKPAQPKASQPKSNLAPVYLPHREPLSRGAALIKQQHSLKDVIILNTILGQPKAKLVD